MIINHFRSVARYSGQPYCDICGMFTFNITPVWLQCSITCCTLIARGMTQLSVDVKKQHPKVPFGTFDG